MKRAWIGLAALVALLAGAAALIAVEFSEGAVDTGKLTVQNPCEPRPQYPGSGIDATIQRVVLDGLDGAACELGTTRERLVLSFEPSSGVAIPWDDETIERAVRAGMLEAIDDAQERGTLNGILATLVRQVVQRAPLQWLIDGGQELADLFG